MLKYFGKYFGPSTRAPKFSTQMLFIIKICFTIKVNTICGAGQDTRTLCHKFNSQDPGLRILGSSVASPKSQIPCASVLVPGSRVSGPDFRLCSLKSKLRKIAFTT